MRSARQDRSVLQYTVAPGTWRRMASYGRNILGLLAALAVLSLIGSVLVVATPLLLQRIIDDGVTPGNRQVVISLAIAVAVIAVVEGAVALAARYVAARVGEGVIVTLRRQVFDHVTAQPLSFFTATRTGSLVSRVNSDIVGAQAAFNSVISGLFGTVVTVFGIIAAMAYLSWPITLLSLVLAPIILLPTKVLGRRLQVLARERMTLQARMSEMMTERFSINGAQLVKLYGEPDKESAEFGERAARVGRIGVISAVNQRLFFVALTAIAALATAATYGIGGVLAISGTMSVGSLLALAALLARLYGPLTSLAAIRLDVMTSVVSFERVFAILDLEPDVVEPENPLPLPPGPLGVRLADVEYSYPVTRDITIDEDDTDENNAASSRTAESTDRELVLRGVNLDVAPGTVVALVGPSGAGKSTLANLILRLADPTAGTVEIGGVDARDVAGTELRKRVSLVPQDAYMFHDTIAANLRYAKPGATDDELRAALEAANLGQLLQALPDGLDTIVGDRGHRLSGGEKQRLAIARLLLRAPDVVVLDEATAHLDSESEAAVQAALNRALEGRTAVIIAHRLSTIRSADMIAVVAGGRITQRGTHESLLAHGGLYAELHRTQFAHQEPANFTATPQNTIVRLPE